jgi:hypothetical protein
MIRLKNIMNENAATEAAIQKIEKATDRNDHNEAIYILADLIGDNTTKKIMNHMKEIHKLEGHMPHELIQYRMYIMKNLMEKTKSKLGNAVAAEINSAF